MELEHQMIPQSLHNTQNLIQNANLSKKKIHLLIGDLFILLIMINQEKKNKIVQLLKKFKKLKIYFFFIEIDYLTINLIGII